ncbi:EpsG family protein [Acinetobacter indicus]|uniref:EpsG family protein n=1 Tax=Acinetobacter indicus TaxID=756892 RepID=UPI0014448561|nr:EpsG family protein [Acinetobacter indicus]
MNVDISTQSKKIIYILVSFFMSAIYIGTYLSIPNEILRDRPNYIFYAANYESILKNRLMEAFFFNEPLFIYINKFLNIFLNPEEIPLFFVFFNASILMFFLIRKSQSLLFFLLGLTLIVFVPYVFQAQMVALRQSLATSFFMLAYFYFKDDWKILLISFLCSFIHSVFFIITVFYFFNFIVLKNKSFETKMLINSLIMLFLSLFFYIVTSYFGMRQSEVYQDMELNVGGGAFLLYLGIFLLLYTQRRKYNNNQFVLIMGGVLLFLAGYFFGPLSARLFNTFFPFLILFLVSRQTYLNLFIMCLLSIVYAYLYFDGGFNDVLLYHHGSFSDFFSHIQWFF